MVLYFFRSHSAFFVAIERSENFTSFLKMEFLKHMSNTNSLQKP